MPREKSAVYRDLSDAVLNLEEEKAATTAQEVVAAGYDAYEAIDRGLADGMARAGKLFEEDEYFVPELLIAADAMYAGLGVLRPHIKIDQSRAPGRVVIGVIEGDTHDIGKNLVKIILEAKGFETRDLGRDIPPAAFAQAAREFNAEIIAISTLMTTTMAGMEKVISLLKDGGDRDQFRVMIGGAPISATFAQKIGADGYAANAVEAGELAVRLINELRKN
ncbi:dimethylamine corrinoid protein [Planctomycetales bacterium]|nr:dimethylamine corrinoid protein [Planctomycetales bacterium]GHT04737.1 dimethylamine corrinoid protein [Planctomycetales bacterium]